MRRRELMLLLAGAMTAARALRAQQKAMPMIGFLNSASPPARLHTMWPRSSEGWYPRFLEGEGLGNDATALILYRFAVAAVSVNLFSFGEARDCSPPLLQAKLFGDRRWLADAPPPVLGRRSTLGDRALDPDAVSCLLAFRASGRFRRAVTVAAGALHQLERSADDQRRYAAPGHLLLGLLYLPDRRYSVSDHRPAGT
jgi:hypothetical protein